MVEINNQQNVPQMHNDAGRADNGRRKTKS